MPAEPTGSRPAGRRALIARPVGLFLLIGSRAFLVTFHRDVIEQGRRCSQFATLTMLCGTLPPSMRKADQGGKIMRLID